MTNPTGKHKQKLAEKMESLLKNFEYKDKEEKEIDWSRYNVAQINEMNDVLNMIRNMVDEAYNELEYLFESNERGRPSIDSADLAKAVLLQQYFGVSCRVAEGLVKLFKEKLDISSYISAKSIERAYERPDVILILKAVFRKTNEPLKNRERKFTIDGTGLPLSVKQNYANDRNDKKAHKGYDKMVGMSSVDYNIFAAVDFAEGTANECPFLQPLLQKTSELYEVSEVYADAGFLSRENCTAIGNVGAVPYIYPKRNVSLKKHGSKEWTNMLLYFIEKPQEWLEHYHKRSNSESHFSSFKRRFSRPLLHELEHRRRTEAFARACVYNIIQLSYCHHLHDIEVAYLRDN